MTHDGESTIFRPETLMQHRAWVQALAHRLVRDQSQVDDLVQQVWLAALRRPPTRPGSLRGWLATVTRNTASKLRRDAARRELRERGVARPEALPSTLEAVQELSVHRGVVDAVLALDEPDRTVLVLRFYRDWKPSRIAAEQGVPVKTVESRLRRALQRLQSRLDREHGGDGRSWALAMIPLATGTELTKATAVTGLGLLALSLKVKVVLTIGLVALFSVAWWSWRSPPTTAVAPQDSLTAANPVRVEGDPLGSREAVAAKNPDAEVANPEAGLTVVLQTAEGEPIDHARIVLFRDQEILVTGEPDRDGTLALGSFELPAALLVQPEGEFPFLHAMVRNQGREWIEAPPREVVSGRVRVDGAAPHRPLSINLSSTETLPPIPSLPAAVWQHMGYRGNGSVSIRKDTDTEGRFEYRGVPAGWRGMLKLSNRYVHDPERGLKLSVPRRGIEWNVHSLPAISGRLVDREGRAVPGCSVSMQGVGATGGFGGGDVTSSRGLFRTSLRVKGIESVELTFTTEEGLVHQLPLESVPDAGLSLGDVMLPASRLIELQVTDAEGEPIEDALAFWGQDFFEHQRRTDPQGRVSLQLSSTPQTLFVGARGHELQEHTLPSGTRDRMLPITLSRATLLTIQLRGDPVAVAKLPVQVDSPVLREGELWTWLHRRTLLGASAEEGLGNDGLRFHADSKGEVVVMDLRPGDPVVVKLLDPHHQELERRELRLHPGEHRHIVFDVPNELRSVMGRVLGMDGLPVTGAQVAVVDEDRNIDVATTPPSGEFQLQGIPGPSFDLKVSASGFATLWFRNLVWPEDGEPLDLRLPRGHSVRVSVLEESGRPLSFARVWAERADASGTAPIDRWQAYRADGEFMLPGLPDVALTLKAKVGVQTYEQPLAATVAEQRLVVPDLGQVHVEWQLPLERRVEEEGLHLYEVHLLPLDDHGIAISENVMRVPPRDAGRCELPAVVPGRYQVAVEYWQQDTQERHREDGGPVVEVRAGEVVTVVLDMT